MRSEARSSRSRRPPLSWVPPTCSRCRSPAHRSSPARAPCGPRARCCPSTRAATTARSCCRRSTARARRAAPTSPARPGSPGSPISDLVAELIAEGLVVETRPARGRPPGQARHAPRHQPRRVPDHRRRPLASTRSSAARSSTSTAASSHRAELALDGATGEAAIGPRRSRSSRSSSPPPTLPSSASASDRPVSSTSRGVVRSAPNLGWSDVPLQARLAAATALPVLVANDANAAVLAEHSFGDARSDLMLVKVGHGVGAGLCSAARPLFGSRFAAGEIGHVVVGTDGGAALRVRQARLPRDLARRPAAHRAARRARRRRRGRHRSRRDPARSRRTPRHRARARRRRAQPVGGRAQRPRRTA